MKLLSLFIFVKLLHFDKSDAINIKALLGRNCFKEYGCFPPMEYKSIIQLPMSLVPMSPESINPVFHIYSPKDDDNSLRTSQEFNYTADSTELKASIFNPKFNTIVITHGFRSGFETWMTTLKDVIFSETREVNMIFVVWDKGAILSSYNQAATNTRLVGAIIASFITTLVKTFGISNDRFHLIGHGLGAHAFGYAGKLLNEPKVARITALDPSGPGFQYFNSSMRLHHTDATFVDIVHTDAPLNFNEGLGANDNYGHLDFYPNGGIKEQSECQPIGFECVDYETFVEGRCYDCRNNKCQPMGLNFKYWHKHNPDLETLNYKYFLNLEDPINEVCVYQYQFAFHVTQDSDDATGLIQLVLDIKTGKFNKQLNIQKILGEVRIGEIHTLLMTFKFKIHQLNYLKIQWKQFDETRENKGKKIKISYVEINFMSHLNESVRQMSSFILCPKNEQDFVIEVNNKSVEYMICKSMDVKEGDRSAKELAPEILVPFTRRDDLIANDYEEMNPVNQKLAKSETMLRENGLGQYSHYELD